MSLNDLVKFITQQFVTYVNKPTDERKAMRLEKKESRPPAHFRMFGMIPLAISIALRKRKSKRRG
ncbi:YqzE family protein [Bacillus sp. FJAT-45350]|uniref:YqzE family protein n=1 Tax=Bacillus sp. FJAT-45350 TaxID=2011014 RepID=UPI000BB6F8C8|nr:YqzE family protein [Bacillus sp. FJAT-45350]